VGAPARVVIPGLRRHSALCEIETAVQVTQKEERCGSVCEQVSGSRAIMLFDPVGLVKEQGRARGDVARPHHYQPASVCRPRAQRGRAGGVGSSFEQVECSCGHSGGCRRFTSGT
jgi:hypothetical protein